MIRSTHIIVYAFFLPISVFGQIGKSARLLRSGKFNQAIDYNLRKLENSPKPEKHHASLAHAYVLLGDDIAALSQYEKALEYIRQKEKKQLRLHDYDVLDEFSLLNIRTGNWEYAKQLAEESRHLRVRWWNKRNPSNFRPYLPLGMWHLSVGSKDSARYYLEAYRKNLKNSNYTGYLDVDKYADVFQVLSAISLEENDFKKALRLSKRSLRLQRHEWTRKVTGKNYADRAKALNTLANIYLRKGNYSRALTANGKSMQLLEKLKAGNALLWVEAFLCRSFLSLHSGNVIDSKEYLLKAMRLQVHYAKNTLVYLSEYEKGNIYVQYKGFLNQTLAIFYKMSADGKVRVDDLLNSKVLDFVINTKGLILAESGRIIEESTKNDSLSFLLSNWKQLKKQWFYLSSTSKNKGRKKSEKINALRQDIVKAERLLINSFKPDSIKTWETIKESLKPNDMAMEIVNVQLSDSTDGLISFQIERDSKFPTVITFSQKVSVKRQIKGHLNKIKYDEKDTLTHSWLWEPLRVRTEIKRIYVSPSGPLNLLNFNAISLPESGFITDKHTIVNVTNVANIGKRERSNQPGLLSAALVIGISDFENYDKSTIGNLPGVVEEVNFIDSLLNRSGIKSTPLLNKEVSGYDLTENYSILHLATHGISNSIQTEDPMLNMGLLLPRTNGDSILTAYEVSLLKLDNTQLVVLSACSSGLGVLKPGEGLYGLQRAFEIAGASYIVTSLWPVDDWFTQDFMKTFYRHLTILQDVESAFGFTLIEMKLKNNNPKYWAAFKLLKCF